MLVKVLSRHTPSYKGLIQYILKESKKSRTNDVFLHNLRGKNIDEWTKEFIENECFRKVHRKDASFLQHVILSLSSNEDNTKITDEMLRDIAEKYFELRGSGVHLGAVHRDNVHHIHLHFITSALEYRTGKSMRLSRDELQTLKIELQNYHRVRYPELSESFCNHGKGGRYINDKEYYGVHKNRTALSKEQLKEQVQSLFSRSTNKQEFVSLLREQNLMHYERGNTITGIMHEDTKFRFSRLGIDFDSLPISVEQSREEDLALAEIRSIRAEMRERDLNKVEEYER